MNTKTINIHAAKTHFSTLVEEVAAGGEIIIAKAGKPVARLVPLEKKTLRKTLGMLKGKIRVSDDFDAPLPPEILRGFGIDK
jgi:prevent-host-death family protein